VLEQRTGLMPAEHDGAALALEQRSAAPVSTTSWSTIRPPPAMVASAPRMKPPLQKSGMCPHQASSGPMPRQSPTRRADVVTDACACTTAFACAVVPEVKNTTAQSMGETAFSAASSSASSVVPRASQRSQPGASPSRRTTRRR
jgi:hypothetical protein